MFCGASLFTTLPMFGIISCSNSGSSSTTSQVLEEQTFTTNQEAYNITYMEQPIPFWDWYNEMMYKYVKKYIWFEVTLLKGENVYVYDDYFETQLFPLELNQPRKIRAEYLTNIGVDIKAGTEILIKVMSN